MYKNKTVGVVIPAYNEETQIIGVLKGLPEYIDKIIVVNDNSSDNTSQKVNDYIADTGDSRVILIIHKKNQGVGGAIATGYKEAVKLKLDATAVMGGDGQMAPEDLPALLDPVVEDRADYSKGNRLITGEAWEKIPKIRYLGNATLSLLTKIASGYWHIADSQTGYTIINQKALSLINIDKIYKRYGVPNDILIKLNIVNMRVVDVPIEPVYNIGEQSKMKIHKIMLPIIILLIKGFFSRLWEKFVIRDFHPLVFFYAAGLLLLPLGTLFGFYLIIIRIFGVSVAPTSALFSVFLTISGTQFLLFAMWFDMEYNRILNGSR